MNKLTPSAATYATWQIRTKRNDLSTDINWGLAALLWPNDINWGLAALLC